MIGAWCSVLNVVSEFFVSFILIAGESIEDDEDDEDDDDEGDEEEGEDEAGAEAYMQEQQAKLEDEKAAILNNQSLIAEVSSLWHVVRWMYNSLRLPLRSFLLLHHHHHLLLLFFFFFFLLLLHLQRLTIIRILRPVSIMSLAVRLRSVTNPHRCSHIWFSGLCTKGSSARYGLEFDLLMCKHKFLK